MRLIGQKVDALAVLQLYKFSDERLLTGVSLNYRPRPKAVSHSNFITGRLKTTKDSFQITGEKIRGSA